MNAIPFIRRTASERVDGTLTVKIDIEPQHRVQFIQMFPEIGSAGALAALTQEATSNAAQQETIAQKPGNLCIMACTFCEDRDFLMWLTGLYETTYTPATAKDLILKICYIKSRKELDTNSWAAKIFHDEFRIPFLEWKEKYIHPNAAELNLYP